MSELETDERNQKITYWAGPDADTEYDDYGRPKIDASVEIDGRWEERVEEVPGPNGTPIQSIARVVVDRDISIGACMWLGEKADYTATETKLVVVAFSKIPDVKGQEYRRVAYLGRASATLPDLNS